MRKTLQVCQVELHPFFVYGYDGKGPMSQQVRKGGRERGGEGGGGVRGGRERGMEREREREREKEKEKENESVCGCGLRCSIILLY